MANEGQVGMQNQAKVPEWHLQLPPDSNRPHAGQTPTSFRPEPKGFDTSYVFNFKILTNHSISRIEHPFPATKYIADGHRRAKDQFVRIGTIIV